MADRPPFRKSKILCVDDDHTMLLIYKKYLKDTDYTLLCAGDAKQAYSIAISETPDLIISDVVMPGEGGLDLCRKIRAVSSLSTSIFLLASGQKMGSADAIKGIDAGADDYLIKPFAQDEFLAKIKAFLRIRHLQEDLHQANQKLRDTLDALNEHQNELERKNRALVQEKEMLENSLRQISLMAKEREKNNEALERLSRTHERDVESLIKILSELIESKRQYHRGHSKKVAEISTFIGRELGLPENEIRNIDIAARLHELGKLTIPEELAMKNPENYTQQEKDFLSQHPAKGAAILARFSTFGQVALIIRHFHEHFDGSGYPDGLAGEAIPLGSRILAAANLFDNLVFRKKEPDIEGAFAVIEEKMGSKYDPAIGYHLQRYVHLHPPDETFKTRELRIYELEPGMVLASGIFTVGGAKLLPVNTTLTEASIRQLANYHKLEPIEDSVFIKS